MKKLFLICLLPIFFLAPIMSQTASELSDGIILMQRPAIYYSLESRNGKGSVTLHHDKSIEDLLSVDIYNASKPGYGFPGYRICIFSQTGQQARQQANDVVNSFMKTYADTAYFSYSEPSFVVMVGNYRNKSDALRALTDIRKTFRSAFIVATLINPPKLKPRL